MQDKNYNIDKEFTNKAWNNMQAMLDKELPVNNSPNPNNKPKLLPLWVSIGIAASMLIAWQFLSLNNNDVDLNKSNTTEIANESKTQLKANNESVLIENSNKEAVKLISDNSKVVRKTEKQNNTQAIAAKKNIKKQSINNLNKQTKKEVVKSSKQNKTQIKTTNTVENSTEKIIASNTNETTNAIDKEALLAPSFNSNTITSKNIISTYIAPNNEAVVKTANQNLTTIESKVKNDIVIIDNNTAPIAKQESATTTNSVISTNYNKVNNEVLASIDKLSISNIENDNNYLAALNIENIEVPVVKLKKRWKTNLKVGFGSNFIYYKRENNYDTLGNGTDTTQKNGYQWQSMEVNLGVMFQKPFCKKFDFETGLITSYKSAKNTNQNALTAALESTDDAFKSPSGYLYNVEKYDDPAIIDELAETYIIPDKTESFSASIPLSIIFQANKRLSVRAGVYGSYRLNKLELANFANRQYQKKLVRAESNYTNRFDYGINTGIRFHANKKLAFEFNYDQGFISEIKNDTELRKNRAFQLSSLINLNRL